MSLPAPIRCEITVPADPLGAFTVFTEEIVAWWPLEQMNVLGPGSLVSFEDDRLVEATVDGVEAVWAQARVWEPGRQLSLSWHPGTDSVSEVTVTFTAAADGTRVALEHAGWEAHPDPLSARGEYESAWPLVLDRYQAQFPAATEPAGTEPAGTEPGRREAAESDPGASEPADTWVALLHTPGYDAPTDAPLFADPRFAEHTAFLQRMSDRGWLVAAGPFAAGDGSGMTILRLPGPDRLAEASGLATIDDGAVTSGLLAVSVRPWNVAFHTLD